MREDKKVFLTSFFCGSAAGFCTGALIGPAEAFKVWLQSSKTRVYNKELAKYLIKSAPLFGFTFSWVCALEFSSNKIINQKYGIGAGIAASAVTGAAFLTVADHLMLYKVLQQKKTSQTYATIKKLYKIHPAAIWTGFSPMVMREAIFILSVMHLGPYTGKILAKANDTSEMLATAAGRTMTGVVTAFVSQPFDILTRELQKKRHHEPSKNPSLIKVLQETSLAALFKGIIPRMALATVGGTLAGGFFDHFFESANNKPVSHTIKPS